MYKGGEYMERLVSVIGEDGHFYKEMSSYLRQYEAGVESYHRWIIRNAPKVEVLLVSGEMIEVSKIEVGPEKRIVYYGYPKPYEKLELRDVAAIEPIRD